MKHTLILVTAFLGLAACQAGLPETASVQNANIASILDKELSNDVATLTVMSDGTVTGTVNGNAAALTWREENGTFCREGSIGTTDVPFKCQTVEIDGSSVSFINLDGSISSSYTMG